jgi:hypothetical protein
VPFAFDPSTGRYRAPNGRFVRDAAVVTALDAVITAQAGSMRDLTQQLVDGTITLALWQAQMMQSVKTVHLVGLALGNGGWRSLDQSDFGWVGQRIRDQYRYLIKFTVELGSGAQTLNGTAVARSALYAQAARGTHREAQRRLARAQMIAGEERRVLGVADHCKTCLEQAKLGWQPFGTLKRIGDSECRVNCHCRFEFRAEPAR